MKNSKSSFYKARGERLPDYKFESSQKTSWMMGVSLFSYSRYLSVSSNYDSPSRVLNEMGNLFNYFHKLIITQTYFKKFPEG